MKIIEYYERLRECIPKVETLDDEPINFDKKISEQKEELLPEKEMPIVQKFISFGISREIVLKLISEPLGNIEKEPDEELLLVRQIKNQTAETKGAREFMEQALDFDSETPAKKVGMAQTMQNFSNRSMRGPIKADRSVSREGSRKKDPMRESTMSFFKEAFS